MFSYSFVLKKFHNLNLIDIDIWITDNGTQVMTIVKDYFLIFFYEKSILFKQN